MKEFITTVPLNSNNLTSYQSLSFRSGGNYKTNYNNSIISFEEIKPYISLYVGNISCSDLNSNISKKIIINCRVGSKLYSDILLKITVGEQVFNFYLKSNEIFYKVIELSSSYLYNQDTISADLKGKDKYGQEIYLSVDRKLSKENDCESEVYCSSNNYSSSFLLYGLNSLNSNPTFRIKINEEVFDVSSKEELVKVLMDKKLNPTVLSLFKMNGGGGMEDRNGWEAKA